MSLFNMLHGFSPLAGIYLKMLGLQQQDIGRFRDAYLVKDITGLHIHVYTRNGGGNRQDHVSVFDAARQHPLYVSDFDDNFDSTYATIVFNLPEKALSIKNIDLLATTKMPMDKFKDTLASLKGEPVEPAPEPNKELLTPVLEQLYELYVADGHIEKLRDAGMVIMTAKGTR